MCWWSSTHLYLRLHPVQLARGQDTELAGKGKGHKGRVAGTKGQGKVSRGIAGRCTILLVEGGTKGLGIGGRVEGAGAPSEEVPHHQRPLKNHPLLRPKPLQRRDCVPQTRIANAIHGGLPLNGGN